MTGRRFAITGRAERIAPFYVMELLERAKAMEAGGEHIIHMEVGEPDFPTPAAVKEGGAHAIEQNRTFYTHSLGTPELRECIARHYRESKGIHLSPDRVVVTSGTSGAFLLLFATLLEAGRRLAIADPGYPCYRSFGELFQGEVLPLPVNEETRFRLTPGALQPLRPFPDLLVLANPSNPTGTVYGRGELAEIAEIVRGRGGALIVDEIYSGLTYDEPAVSALSVSDDIIVVDGFSKTYAMTGWRLGWMVVPRELLRPIQKIAQNVFISPPAVSQHAALSAFDAADAVETMRGTYRQRRDYLVPALRGLGFHIPLFPEGAFYVYAGIERWGIDSMEFAERCLAEAKVAITPGYDFGAHRASSHVRFTYANSLDTLKEGCRRLGTWLRAMAPR